MLHHSRAGGAGLPPAPLLVQGCSGAKAAPAALATQSRRSLPAPVAHQSTRSSSSPGRPGGQEKEGRGSEGQRALAAHMRMRPGVAHARYAQPMLCSPARPRDPAPDLVRCGAARLGAQVARADDAVDLPRLEELLELRRQVRRAVRDVQVRQHQDQHHLAIDERQGFVGRSGGGPSGPPPLPNPPILRRPSIDPAQLPNALRRAVFGPHAELHARTSSILDPPG